MFRKNTETTISLRAFGLYAVAIVVKLWLISGFPITAIYAPHDDYLFVRQALSLLGGKWLGPFYHLTLAKGPFFPIWLAAMNLLALPYAIALQVSYLVACLVFVIALRPLQLRENSFTAIFFLLWFSPASFTASDFRVERSALYPSLVLLSVAFAIGLATRGTQHVRVSWIWPVGLGISSAAFWLTREEGVWLLPTLLLIFVGALLYASSDRVGSWLVSAAIACLCVALVAGLNHLWYGRFMVIQAHDSAFVDAYRAITRLGDDSPRLMVAMSSKTIEKAAAVSPAFAALRPFIVNGYPSWRNFAKTVWAGMYPDGPVKQTLTNDSDAIGGYFIWDFLAAAEQAGFYANAASAHAYFARLAGEINATCDSGRTTCRPNGEDPVPGWKAVPTKPFLASFERALLVSFLFPRVEFPKQCENVDSAVLDDFRRLTRSAIDCHNSYAVSLRGWVLAKDGEPSLVATHQGTTVWRSQGFIASPDVASQFAGTEWQSRHAQDARFEAQLPCSDCDLALEINGMTVKSAPISQWQPGCPEGEGWKMCIDAVSQLANGNQDVVISTSPLKQTALSSIGLVYRYGVVILAALVFVVILLRRRAISDSGALALLFAASCIFAVIVRAFILAWVDVVSFPSVLLQYSHASYVLFLTGTVFLVLAAADEQ